MPMHPSTQVTHMPEAGTTESTVRFFVRVAAEAFILEKVSDTAFAPLVLSIFLYFTGYARIHIAHHIIELFFLDAGRRQICAGPADSLLRLIVCASKLTGRTDVHTTATQSANIRFSVKRRPNAPLLASVAKAYGLGHHLFLAHPHAQSAKNAVLMLLPEALLANTMGGSEVLNRL
jgi:hypothetical protein